ncbi:MAG: metallophosphoesterase [Tissierella sp.]|nr:metallophosphoesterase [Tissierella sp.]
MIYIAVIAISLTLFCIWQNNHIVISNFNYNNKNLPNEFDGFKIVHISDLHNKLFGKNQEYILKKINSTSPDIIVVTGDLIDRRRYDLETSLLFIEGAMEIAPIYYVSGNHEAWSGEYENIRKELISQGVVVLDDKKVELIRDKEKIEILGLTDPAFLTSSYSDKRNTSVLEKHLKIMKDDDIFQILLSHRPDLIDIYSREKIDMIFSGHAHGGQVRLPGIGGIVAPDQGFFPKYTSGSHTVENSTMYVSRGLGNSLVPIRIFNRPEVVVVTLSNK